MTYYKLILGKSDALHIAREWALKLEGDSNVNTTMNKNNYFVTVQQSGELRHWYSSVVEFPMGMPKQRRSCSSSMYCC